MNYTFDLEKDGYYVNLYIIDGFYSISIPNKTTGECPSSMNIDDYIKQRDEDMKEVWHNKKSQFVQN